jgi:ectoine hydroxylase-related dioxygenase (phytanoyl-CoA dioxygenase family)
MPIATNSKSPSVSMDEFQRDGYVALTPLFDGEKMAEINQNVARYIQDVMPTMPATQVYYENHDNKETLKQLQRLFEYDDYFHQLMHTGIVRQIAETVLDDEVLPVNMQYFNKPPGVGLATPAHQDGYYFHIDPCEAVTGWLALDAVDEENGCIHYVRGSHKKNTLRPHGSTGVLGFSQGITDFGNHEDVANSVAFPGQAGTFLMHHARTIHYAGANLSNHRSRRALGFIYYAKRAKEDVVASRAYQAMLDARLKQKNRI